MITSIQQPLKVNPTLSTLLTELGEEQGRFILDLDNEFRQFQQSKAKIPEACNSAYSSRHKTSSSRMKQP